MPLKEMKGYEGDEKLKIFIFDRTPIMSTYLLGWMVFLIKLKMKSKNLFTK